MNDNKILVGDMSRKQCLEILKRLLEVMETFDGISPSPERINALKMAISSLETDEAYQLEYESTTKDDLGVGCIDRKKLIDWINIWDITPIIKNPLIRHIQGMPSVTPQTRKGHWIVQPSNKEQGERDFIWWKCSECGQVIFSETEHDRLEFHSFCGRCGADMREVVEE